MNPCPCGYLSDPKGRCHCTQDQVARYRARISGPLLDRIDLQIEVPALPIEALSTGRTMAEESSETVLNRVILAVKKQHSRSSKLNARLNNREIQTFCALKPNAQTFINQAIEKLGLSARAYHRILRVARTIADLNNEESVEISHLSEALSFKKMSVLTSKSITA